MKCSAKIRTFDPPKKVDSLLDNRLLNFAYVTADLIMIHSMDTPGNPRPELFMGFGYGLTKSSVAEELAFIEKIKRDFLDKLRFYSKKFLIDKELDRKSPKKRDETIAKRFGLGLFFKALEKRKEFLKININHDFLPERRGRPVDIKTDIASIWSMVMKESGKVCWSSIVKLLEWFYSRLKDTTYGEDIKLSEEIKDKAKYLKKQCSRITEKYPFRMEDGLRTYFEPVPEWFMFPHSIEFSERSIKIGGTWGERLYETKELKFINGEKPKLTEEEKEMPPDPPHIAFPSGEVYRPPSQT